MANNLTSKDRFQIGTSSTNTSFMNQNPKINARTGNDSLSKYLMVLKDCTDKNPKITSDNWRCNSNQGLETIKKINVYSLEECHQICNNLSKCVLFDFGLRSEIGRCFLYSRNCLNSGRIPMSNRLRFTPSSYVMPFLNQKNCTHKDYQVLSKLEKEKCMTKSKEKCNKNCYWTTPNLISKGKICKDYDKLGDNEKVIYGIDDLNMCH